MKCSTLNSICTYVEFCVRDTYKLEIAAQMAGLSIPIVIPYELDWDISAAEINTRRGFLRLRAEFTFGDNHKGCISIHARMLGNKLQGDWELELGYEARSCIKEDLPSDIANLSIPLLALARQHKRAA